MTTCIAELALWVAAFAGPQDLDLRDVRAVTGTENAWPAREISVRDGRIADPGAEPAERALELGGRAWVYPGFVDAHAHLLGLGRSLDQVDLVGTRSYAEVVERVRARAETMPAGSWILGRGWDQNDWDDPRLPAHDELSAAIPDHPVLLTRIDGHALLANAAAMRAAAIDTDTASPPGGEILREDGVPTGVFVDRAMALVGAEVPDATPEQVERWLLAAQRECLRLGLTCVHDAGVDPSTLAIMRRLHASGRWFLRVYAMLPAGATAAIEAGPWQTPDRILTVRAVKGYADGALGSRGAALLEPYADRPGSKGLLITPPAGLRALAQRCADHGFQLCVHAIGDAANRAVLDAYERTEHRGDRDRARFRIEHAQIVHPDDFVRFRELGVIPSMQPTHLTSDMPWAPARLGPERIRGAYAWRSFLELGLPLPFGSDFPVESADPLLGWYAAATTRSADGGPELRPEQKLDRAQILRGFTRDAAYASFFEHDLGTIEAGKLADLTVLDRDLMTCDSDEIRGARVLATIVGGELAWLAPDAERPRAEIRAERLHELVGSLAADDLLGRDTPSEGLERAAEIVAAAFGAVGVWPLGDRGTYFRAYEVPGVEIDSADVHLAIEGSDRELRGERDLRIWRPGRALEDRRGEYAVVAPDQLRPRASREPLLVSCAEDSVLWRSAGGVRRVLARRLRNSAPVLLVRSDALGATEVAGRLTVPAAQPVDVELRNVVGRLPGGDLAGEHVLVTAHYDHVGVRPSSGDDRIFNGADDDATGVAAVVAIAESLARSGLELRRTAVFACFSGEEKGLLGSKAFVAESPFPLESIAAVVNLEMLGRPRPEQRGEAWITGRSLSDLAEIAAPVLARSRVRLGDYEHAEALFFASDNLPFARAGVVAHSLSAGYLHEDYHGPGDEADLIDYEHMAAVVGAVRDLVVELANRDGRPAFTDEGRRATSR